MASSYGGGIGQEHWRDASATRPFGGRGTVSESESSNRAGDEPQQPLREWLELSEGERQLVAYEIHDGFVQQATGALMHLQAFRELRDRAPEQASKALDLAMASLEEGIREARRLMAGLRPPVLEEAGLVAALDDLARDANRREQAEIEFSHSVQFDRLYLVTAWR